MRTKLLLAVCSLASFPAVARAQCAPEWDARFAYPGTQSPTATLCVFDEGSGPRLCVGGIFGLAGGLPAASVASFDGTNWSTLQGGVGGGLFASVVFDAGSGPQLHVGGSFTLAAGAPASFVARWDGAAWSSVGTGLSGNVGVLAVFDDGSGPRLIASAYTGVPGSHRVVALSGTTWVPLGGDFDGALHALAVHDEGSGPRLFAGGSFANVGGTAASNVARWDGNAWSAVGPAGGGAGVGGEVLALLAFDDGSGPALFAGGSFGTAGGIAAQAIARWNGAAWSALGNGTVSFGGRVSALAAFDDGSGPALHAGGSFTALSGTSAARVARWNGTSWSPLAGGFQHGAVIESLAEYDDGTGAKLFVAGEFTRVDGILADRLACWDGARWVTTGQGLDGPVTAITACDPGGGEALFVAGHIHHAGGPPARGIARWDGAAWSTLGSGFQFGGVLALAGFDGGGGTDLFVAGEFTTAGGAPAPGLARWDGSAWSSVGGMIGAPMSVRALRVHDDGAGIALFAAGSFSSAGGVPAANIARFDGNAWSALGAGLTGVVDSLAVFDDGTGAQLYACGSITSAGGVAASGIARWNGSAWSTIPGPGFGLTVLAVHDFGAGKRLVAGGTFAQIGGVPASNVAAWDGQAWSALGGGVNGFVRSLASFDDGCGDALFVGGTFTQAGGAPALRIARFDGVSWSALGSGIGALLENGTSVNALAVFDDGADGAADLYLGGSFSRAGAFGSSSIAQWHGTPRSIVAYCFGDGTGSACPCANTGASGHGCASSAQPAGALLGASTTGALAQVSSDTVVLAGSNMSASSTVLYFQGTTRIEVAFGDGLRCVGGSVVRLAAKTNVGGASQYPGVGELAVSARGMIPPAGGTRTYQCWYRNAAPFCTSASFNLSNGVEIAWRP